MSSLGGLSSGIGSIHHDVLTASPSNSVDKFRLVEELKRRGKSCVLARSFPDASLLYKKGIELLTSVVDNDIDGDDEKKAKKELAVFYSNHSMVLLQMGNADESIDEATRATESDPKYLKGFWRLGQACSAADRHVEAFRAYEAASDLEKDNKAVKKEMEKCRIKIEQAMRDGKEPKDESKPKPVTEPAKPLKPKKKKSATSEEKKSDSSSAAVVDDEDHKIFTKSEPVRGYKVVDGKKTSYFHHEQTEEEKKLIGDITPKRLDSTASAESSGGGGGGPSRIDVASTKQEGGGTSAWNKAGTWEERDVTPWAKETLTASLLTAKYVLPPGSPDPNAVCEVVEVKDLEGHAAYASVRGKKRYIHEFSLTIRWTVTLGDGEECEGSVTFPDIDGTTERGEGYDIEKWKVNDGAPPSAKHLLERFVKDGGLRDVIHGKIDDWVDLFRATY